MTLIVTLKDTVTGAVKQSSLTDCDLFWWAEGNGSCDCNRLRDFFSDQEFEEYKQSIGITSNQVCLGERRFIVVDVEGDLGGVSREYAIKEMNSDYKVL